MIKKKIADEKEARIKTYSNIITKTIATIQDPQQRREALQEKLDNLLDIECDQDVVREMRKRFRMAIREQSLELAAGEMQIEDE